MPEERQRRWKSATDEVNNGGEGVVTVDVHTSLKPSNREAVKTVDAKNEDAREGSTMSVSDESVEMNRRREERSASPSPSDRRIAAAEDMDHIDDFKEKPEELDYEEAPQQTTIVSTQEKEVVVF